MISATPWHTLNIDVTDALNENFNVNSLLAGNTSPARIWDYIGDKKYELFNDSWLKYMESIGVPIAGALIFWRDSNYQHPTAHIDVAPNECTGLSAAINWCISEDKAEMVWYELPKNIGDDNQTSVDSNYMEWNTTELVEVNRRIIGNKPTLVRVDIPHNVIMNDVPRVLITARTMEVFQDWEDVKTYFKTLI
jgi:hypothetical protein